MKRLAIDRTTASVSLKPYAPKRATGIDDDKIVNLA